MRNLPRVDRAHATLQQRHGAVVIYSVLLVRSGKPIGAVTLERSRSDPLPRAEVALVENIGALLGPLLADKHAVSRAWPMKIVHALRGQPGQIAAARANRALLAGSAIRSSHLVHDDRVQDPYSLRCQPQVMGACRDLIDQATRMLLARLSAARSGEGRTVRLETNLIVRSSTAAPRLAA